MQLPRRLKLEAIGSSLGVILPEDLLAEIGLKGQVGETIVLLRCPTTGRLEISADDPEFRKKLDALRRVMDHHDDALRQLAK